MLRVALSMAAGLTDKLIGWEDIIAIMDAADASKVHGPYKKQATNPS
jgi:hypothetical protein